MPTVSDAPQQVQEAVRRLQLDRAVQILAEHPDLRLAEMPKMDAETAKSMAANPDAVKALVLGLAHHAPSVRRFCKRGITRVGPACESSLVLLALDGVRPLRRGVGALGIFGTFASPIGSAILGQSMKMVPKPPARFSEGGKFAREVLSDVVSLLADMDPKAWLPLLEYRAAFFRSILDSVGEPVFMTEDRPFLADPSEPQSHYLLNELDALEKALHAAAAEPDPGVLLTLELWMEGRLLLDRSDPDATRLAIRERFQEMRELDRTFARLRMRRVAVDVLPHLPRDARIRLYERLDEMLPSLPDSERKLLHVFHLERFRKAHPAEYEDMVRATL